MASPNLNPSPSWLLPPLPKTQPLPPWLPLGPHLNLTFTSHYSLAHWLVLTSTPPSLGSSPPYLKPNPSLPGYLSALSSLPHTYILYPFYCFSPPRAAPMLIIFLPLTLTGHSHSLTSPHSHYLPPSLPLSLSSLALISSLVGSIHYRFWWITGDQLGGRPQVAGFSIFSGGRVPPASHLWSFVIGPPLPVLVSFGVA